MIRNSLKPKTPFTKATDRWPSTCARCGADVSPTYDSIATKARKHGDSPRGCRPCADRDLAEANKLDEAELLASIVAANIEPLEPYRNNSTPWKCRCLNQGCPRKGKPIKVTMKTVRRGGMACKYCARHEIHPDDAFEMMLELGQVRPTAPYPGVDQPWPGDCLRCGSRVSPRLHDVKNGGQGACQDCAPNTPLTPAQAWDRAVSYRVLPNDKAAFRNTNTPWEGTCMDCLAPVSPSLGNLYRGQGACNACKRTGFNDQKPAVVYLLHRSAEPAMAKIGICEDAPHNTRLKLHRGNDWEVAYTLPFMVGLHARLVESAIKRLWFKERGWEDGRARGEARFDGYTETVVLHDLGRAEPWEQLTAMALWTDVLIQAGLLGFAPDEAQLSPAPAITAGQAGSAAV
ncbi:hypothetical protein OG689_42050 [Kitasatospora sp. NBC_00240]|uniref:hypothetical protein n=1 Tax=Kitasatospora sp. NBC_00240 TaxID=2903567 RepID=UPI00225436E1|nr:hypothetical protein [Kitasatospora sp. NBC_00240]MCX5215740.1 hypothetical protein [Kitasatospora sp. NBC_00240]